MFKNLKEIKIWLGAVGLPTWWSCRDLNSSPREKYSLSLPLRDLGGWIEGIVCYWANNILSLDHNFSLQQSGQGCYFCLLSHKPIFRG